jgi:uncharacterized membrane protein YvbJ
MSACRECGHNNREGNNFCVNCGCVLAISDSYLRKQRVDNRKVVVAVVVGAILFFIFYCALTAFNEQEADREYEKIKQDTDQEYKKIDRDSEQQTDKMMRDLKRDYP